MTEPKEIQLLSQAKTMLAEARSFTELKDIRDKAEAVRMYCRSRGDSLDAQNYAAEVRLLSERKIGELLMLMDNHGGDRKTESSLQRESLKDIGISHVQSHRWQTIASVPDADFERHIAELKGDGHEITTASVLQLAKELKQEKRKSDRAESQEEIKKCLPTKTDRYTLIHAAIADLTAGQVADASVDWIITDPPYPKEFLPVYSELAVFARRVLKDGGSLICMIGQSYLPQIVNALASELNYHWVSAYMTPGAATPIYDRKINTNWKPLLWFTKGKSVANEWTQDVFRSEKSDKDHHHWGQSESGMADIIGRLTRVGDVICDPFFGGGTTGVVAVQLNRLFIGVDSAMECIDTALQRLEQVEPDA